MDYGSQLGQNAPMARELLLLSCLGRGLAHQLRTDLSVLVNELTYFNSQLGAGDCDLALERCRKMSNFLKGLSSLADPPLNLKQELAGELCRLVADCSGIEILQSPAHTDAALLLDKEKFSIAISRVFELLGVTLDRPLNQPALTVNCLVTESQIELILEVPGYPFEPETSSSYDSLSAFFILHLGRDSIAAPIADAILLSHNAVLRLKVHDRSHVELVLSFERIA